jgi:acyl transferase domain-containing protein
MKKEVNESKRGGMVAVGLSEKDTRVEIEPFQSRLCIAAINSSASVTVSGDLDAVEELQKNLSNRGIFARALQVKQAFHSHHMFPLAPAYQGALEASPLFTTLSPTCRMYSRVTSRLASPEAMGPAYWAENMVKPVRFSGALTGTLIGEEENQVVDVLIEM